MSFGRRTALLGAAAGALLAHPGRAARAQQGTAAAAAGWMPSRPVNWIVTGGPASVLDVGARLIAQKMAPRWASRC
jgi:tripartite-type tricarboxylate transporter receptor subunit TctC